MPVLVKNQLHTLLSNVRLVLSGIDSSVWINMDQQTFSNLFGSDITPKRLPKLCL